MSNQIKTEAQGQKGPERLRRGYRACLHCRSRKAKCDLGDIDAPSSPPCSRCRRESRECVFAPSRRGGHTSRKDSVESDAMSQSRGDPFAQDYSSIPPEFLGMALDHRGSYAYASSERGHHDGISMDEPGSSIFSHQNPHPLHPPDSPYYPRPHLGGHSDDISPQTGNTEPTPPTNSGSNPILPQHPPAAAQMHHTRRMSMTPSPKRRRLHLNPPLHAADPSSIVVADMQNESDALHILALASGHAEGRDEGEGEDRGLSSRGESTDLSMRPHQATDVRPAKSGKTGSKKSLADGKLEDFALIKLGIATKEQIEELTNRFFECHHHLFPMVPSSRIPKSGEQFANFARDEPYLLTGIVIIASRNMQGPGMRSLHDSAWAVMRGWLGDIQCLGAPATVGLVESLLLLAENLPRSPGRRTDSDDPDEVHAYGLGEELHGKENRQAWMLIGMAIRAAYGLGLDKLGMKLFDETERTFDIERGRLAWTYCYLFDRHISLRLGKAFWSRGPAVCFQGYSSSTQTGPAAGPGNFPFLREIGPGDTSGDPEQEDLASLIQAYVELTQMMSSAHDVLYPNPARTKSLVVYGEYFKYLDELMRSLDGFKVLWRQKEWKIFPLNDAVWAMFYYAQLYICAFSYQAHVERAAMRADEEYQKLEQLHKANGSTADLPRPALSLFPRGAAHSPDARYIFQSCDAARALLKICVDSLHPKGVLPFLPSRFLLWFTYAAILLLKAVHSGAVLRADQPQTLKLIDRLCTCLCDTSLEPDDAAPRYGRQLQGLRRKLSALSDITQTNSPTGGGLLPLPPMHAKDDEFSSMDNANGHTDPLPWLPDTRNNAPTPSANDVMDWSFPFTSGTTPKFPFSYQTPPSTSTGIGTSASGFANMAPPHQQPMSDIGSLLGGNNGAVQNNLGFTTLDDWFGQNLGDESGDVANGGLGGLDLQDFWMKVGPSEAQGGFPFR